MEIGDEYIMWKLYEHPIRVHKAIVVVPDIGEHVKEYQEPKHWTLEDRDADKAIYDDTNPKNLYKYTEIGHAVKRCSELNQRDYGRN